MTGTLTADERRVALSGFLRHEVVHALRYLDLWKKTEWKSLEKAAGSLKKQGTDQTYLDVAKKNYADQNQVVQIEEAIADMIRDVADRRAKVAGRPRTLSERAVNFFDKAKNALTGAGFQTYDDVINRFEQGVIGARQRGQVRTLRAVEERAAEKGEVPERLQRLFTNPEERNKFRDDTVQNLWGQTKPTSPFTANTLRSSGIRESRAIVDPVPPKIKVNEQEVPTKDSEGRLIYSGYEGPEMFGTQTAPTQEGLTNFWNWFGKSKAADKQGRPLVFYHGTAADITAFRPKQAGSVFITRSPEFAEEFGFLSDNYMVSNFPNFMSDQQVLEVLDETLASPNAFSPKFYDRVANARDQAAADVRDGKAIRLTALQTLTNIAAEGRSSRYLNAIQKRLPSSANVMPVYVKADKPWDYQNKDDVKAVIKRARDNGADITGTMAEEIAEGNWQTIEGSTGNAPILDAIRELGYDSMYVEEQGEKNLAVFNPEQIKSAIGNNGQFSPATPSIRESRPESFRAPKKRNKLIVRELFDYSTDDKGRLIVKKNIDKARQLAKKVAKPKVDKDGALVFKAADADDVVNALNNMPTADASIASQVARRLNLSEEEINATSLPFQTGEPTNRAFDTEFIGELPDVVQYLEDRRLESGIRPLNIASEEDQDVLARLIAAETLGAIRSSGNALEWYDETIGKALGIASLKYPELQSDPNAQGIFTIAMAISSQGLNVENNFKFTFKQYDAFRRTGRFPEIGEGEASGAMAKNFKLANDLMDEFGDIGTLRRFLATPFSVEELRRTGFNITDELGDEMVLGSSVFGPKIGFGFYSNLNGNFEPVTMDMWFMRLIGRLIGKLKQFDPDLFAEQLATFRNSLDERGEQGIYADRFDADLVSRAKTDDEAALELARRVKKAHEKDFKTNRAEFDAGERLGLLIHQTV